MKQLVAPCIALLFSFLSFSSLHAQGIDSMMREYAEKIPQQKVYVHFDKGAYRSGETIWFKAYLFAGFQPALTSKNIFTELIDNNGNVLQRKVFPLVESSAGGYFDIPENANYSKVSFRAYTTWMLNFDTAFIFQRSIDIIGKGKAPASSIAAAASPVSLHFFPEGGNLVNTIESFVAFKANDDLGLPVYVSGEIKNNKGEVVETFKAEHDGMGEFKVTPQNGETYTAYWRDDKGADHKTVLPAAKAQGVALSITSVPNKKIFIIKRSMEVVPAYHEVIIVATIAGEVVYKAKVSLESTFINSGNINISTLPAGIMQITLFSQNWEPLAERIVMVNNNNYQFDVSVVADTANLNIRAKNVFEIKTGDTTLSNMSIAITDAGIANKSNVDNIISGLLLSGDIKGYVHNPAYYFSNKSDSIASHLDLVLLTNGWRRYNWSELAQGKLPALKFPKDEYLALNAKVFGVTAAHPLRKDEMLTAIVFARDSSKQFIQIPKTGPDMFSLENAIFFDTVNVLYQFALDRKMQMRATVKFDNGLYKGFKKVNLNALPYSFTSVQDSALLSRTKFMSDQLAKYNASWQGKGNVLQSVTVKTKAKTKIELLDEKYASGLFKGSDAINFDLVSEPATFDVLTFLQGRVPGLQINNNGANSSISWRGSSTAIFIDEFQADIDRLQTLSPSDIAYIKVFRPPFFGSTGGGAGGAIAIYTRRGGDIQSEPGKGLLSSQVEGYAYNKEFYSPDYSTRSSSTDVVADYRSTLYWNPYIFMDATRQSIKVRFFNNDITKAFRVILEGVNESGKLVRIEKIIQ